jgi:hypothetical protein
MRSCRIALAGLAVSAGLLIPVGAGRADSPTRLLAPAAHQAVTGPAGGAHARWAAAGTARLMSAAAAASIHGCPYGYACMYTTSGFSKNTPEHKYYYYGCYDLSNETGTRYMVNNQSGGATVSGYYNYGCTSKAWTIPPPFIMEVDITPINSISLNP